MSSGSSKEPSPGLDAPPSSNPPAPPGVPSGAAQGRTIYARFNEIPEEKKHHPDRPAKYADLHDKLDFNALLKVHERPCGKEGLLTGIGAGGAVGMLRFIFGAPIPKAANWAVGVFGIGSIASYEYCKAKRRREHAQVSKIIKVYNAEREKVKKEEEAAARMAEEERIAAESRKSKWYKFWR